MANSEQLIFGTSFILLAMLFIVIYIIAELAIYRDKDLYECVCYKFMFWLGIFEIANCFFYGVFGGIMVLAQSTFDPIFHKIMAGLTSGLFTTSVMMECVLAFNRFFAVWFKYNYPNVFSAQMFKLWLGFCVACGLSNYAIFLVPGYDNIFVPDKYYWWYSDGVPKAVLSLQMFRDAAAISVMLVCYVLIAVRIRKLLAMVSHTEGGSDMQVFAAPFAITVALTIETLYYFIVPNLSGVPPIVNMLSNVWDITVTGVNGILYIAFNKSIRRSCRKLLCGPATAIVPTTTVSHRSGIVKNEEAAPVEVVTANHCRTI